MLGVIDGSKPFDENDEKEEIEKYLKDVKHNVLEDERIRNTISLNKIIEKLEER